MKVGILTYHRAHNYGAFLQAQALCGRLNQEDDIEAEIIDFRMKKEKKRYSLIHKIPKWIKNPRRIRFDVGQYAVFSKAFIRSLGVRSLTSCVSDSIETFQSFVANKYDAIVAGSDEIWKTDGFRGFPNPYWLPGNLGCRKLSFAASSRSNFNELSKEQVVLVRKYLNDFEYVGVRDQLTYKEIVSLIDNKGKVQKCSDPSFLFDFKIVETKRVGSLLHEMRTRGNGKVILLMTADKGIGRFVYDKFHNQSSVLSVFHWHKGCKNVGNLTPYEWMYLLKNVDFVVTTYFHATCFSIVFNTPFIAIGAKNKSEKLEELLNSPELKKRYIADFYTLKDTVGEELEPLMARDDYAEYIQRIRMEFEDFLSALRNTER